MDLQNQTLNESSFNEKEPAANSKHKDMRKLQLKANFKLIFAFFGILSTH